MNDSDKWSRFILKSLNRHDLLKYFLCINTVNSTFRVTNKIKENKCLVKCSSKMFVLVDMLHVNSYFQLRNN